MAVAQDLSPQVAWYVSTESLCSRKHCKRTSTAAGRDHASICYETYVEATYQSHPMHIHALTADSG